MREKTTLVIGLLFLGIEILVFIFIVIVDPTYGAKTLSMVAANHFGGRLAFIAMGLENGLTSYLIILIIVLYNTTYVLLMYSLFVFFSVRVKRLKFIRSHIESLQNNANKKKKLLRKWNWLGISIFVWIPLPWTGAVIGSYIAHLEGYNTRDTLLMVIPSMWIGVISWTLWFDELYEFIDQFGNGRTIFMTIFLLTTPIFFYLLEVLKKIKTINSVGE